MLKKQQHPPPPQRRVISGRRDGTATTTTATSTVSSLTSSGGGGGGGMKFRRLPFVGRGGATSTSTAATSTSTTLPLPSPSTARGEYTHGSRDIRKARILKQQQQARKNSGAGLGSGGSNQHQHGDSAGGDQAVSASQSHPPLLEAFSADGEPIYADLEGAFRDDGQQGGGASGAAESAAAASADESGGNYPYFADGGGGGGHEELATFTGGNSKSCIPMMPHLNHPQHRMGYGPFQTPAKPPGGGRGGDANKKENNKNGNGNNGSSSSDAMVPIVFGDPAPGDNGSVMTGMSQQELLRKKAREHGKKDSKRSGGGSGKSGKGNQHHRILNMPASLRDTKAGGGRRKNRGGGGGGHSKVADLLGGGKASSAAGTSSKSPAAAAANKVDQQPRYREIGKIPSRSTDSDFELSTAESTKDTGAATTSSAGSGSGAQQHQLPSATNSEEDGGGGNDAAEVDNDVDDERTSTSLLEAWAFRTNTDVDLQSIGEESFPILSSKGGGFSVAEEPPLSLLGKMQPQTADDDDDDDVVLNPDFGESGQQEDDDALGSSGESSSRRGVRFPRALEPQVHVYTVDEASEAPWDEKGADDFSPTSVMNIEAALIMGGDPTASPTFEAIAKNEKRKQHLQSTSVPPPPASSSSPPMNSAAGNPKSILRSPRFSPPNSANPNAAMNPFDGNFMSSLFGVPYPSLLMGKFANLADDGPSIETRGVDTSVSLSPPRNGTAFKDDGVELSPIQKKAASEEPENPANKINFREFVERANCMYPDPALLLEETSLFSDPTAEILSESNIDDDTTVLSTVAFIQSVASVVIQTAWRRYGAMKVVRGMRESNAKDSTEVTAPPASVVNAITSSTQQEARLTETKAKDSTEAIAPPASTFSTTSRQLVTQQEEKFESMAARLYVLAAIRIQSVFRGWWVRDCLSVDQYCAKVIQGAWRAFRCRNDYHYDVYRVIMVQSVWRKNIARVKVANLLWSTTVIQAACRGLIARKESKRILARRSIQRMKRTSVGVTNPRQTKEDAAATIIQAQWRAYLGETRFIQRLVDILIVQSAIRRFLAIRTAKSLRLQQRRNGRFARFRAAQSHSHIPARNSHGVKPPVIPAAPVSKKPEWPPTKHQQAAESSSICSGGTQGETSQEPDEAATAVDVVPGCPQTASVSVPPSSKKEETRAGAKSVLKMWQEREKKSLAVNSAPRHFI